MRKSMLAVIAALAMVAGPAAAQQRGDREVEVQAGQTRIQVDPAERESAQTQETRRANRRAGQAGQVQGAGQRQGGAGLAVRATDLAGMEVRNMQDEDLGEVNDVVIDLQTGRVRYIALSVGGALGVGDKLFAVPWSAFRYRMQDDEQYLVLNATAEKFENAPGFDDNNWPDFADRQWRTTNDTFYCEQGFTEQQQPGRSGGEGRRRPAQTPTQTPPADN